MRIWSGPGLAAAVMAATEFSTSEAESLALR
jgi:hypothetical protein